MSFLAEGQDDIKDSPKEQPKTKPMLGNLRPNPKARGRRDKVKFFDSADWAMKSQNDANESVKTTPQNLQAYTEQGNDDDGTSLLATGN